MTCKPQIPWLVHLVQQHQVQTAQNKHRCFYTSRGTVKAQASTSQAISVQTKMAQGSEYWSKSLVHNLLSKMCLLGSDITKSSSSALKSHFILNSTSTTRHGFIIPPSGLHCTCFFFSYWPYYDKFIMNIYIPQYELKFLLLASLSSYFLWPISTFSLLNCTNKNRYMHSIWILQSTDLV